MAELPHPWGAYAHLQEPSRRPRLDHRAWGYEAGLDLILASNPTAKNPSQEDIDRAVASGARLERYRARLRGLYLQDEEVGNPSTGMEAFEAQEALQHIQDSLASSDWTLLWKLAVGHEYAEIAQQRGVTAGSLRARVLRLRRSLANPDIQAVVPGRDATKEVLPWY